MQNKLMTGSLTAILKQGLDEHAKNDAAFAEKYRAKKLDDCVLAIYEGLERIAREAIKGTGCAGTCGSDQLLISAAIHFYDEDNPTAESIYNILKGGTEVLSMKKPAATQPPSAEKGTTTKKNPTPAMKVVKSIPKPTPKPVPKPVPTITLDEDDDDGEMF